MVDLLLACKIFIERPVCHKFMMQWKFFLFIFRIINTHQQLNVHNMHTNIIISNFLIFFIAHGQYAEEICPQKVTSGDRFKATERFEALRKAVTMK